MLLLFDNSYPYISDIFGASAYFRLSTNSDIANRVAAEVVTKPESMTLEELFSYMKQEASKVQELCLKFFFFYTLSPNTWILTKFDLFSTMEVAWFEITATIDDVVKGSAWYYISCGGCKSKAVNGPTSLLCNNKRCGKSEVTDVAQ